MSEQYFTMGMRLRSERERLGLTQDVFASALKCSKRSLINYEKGEHSPDAELLAAAAQKGTDVKYVITGSRGMSGSAPAPASNDDSILIPHLAAVGNMGNSSALLVEHVIIGEVPFSRRWLWLHVPPSRPEGLRLVSSYGDRMKGTLDSGDFALVDTDCQVGDIDGIYVLQADDQLFIKRVTRKMDGRT